jgi:hypothetical protein
VTHKAEGSLDTLVWHSWTTAGSLICETDEARVAEILWEGEAIRPRPWIESPSEQDPGIARIL